MHKNIIYRENTLTVEEYLYLRRSVNWLPLIEEQAKKALKNSIYTITAYADGKPVGMGRMVGDESVIVYVQDLIVHPDLQQCGLGQALLQRIIDYAEDIRIPGTQLMLDLMCAKGREQFYEKMGFLARPTNQLGPGMILYLNDRNGE